MQTTVLGIFGKHPKLKRRHVMTLEEEHKAQEALKRLARFVGRYGVHATSKEDLDALEDLSTLRRLMDLKDGQA